MENKKATHGGAGRGQGRKPQFNEPTDTIAFRLPISLIEKIKSSSEPNKEAYTALKKHFDGIQEQSGTDAKDGG